MNRLITLRNVDAFYDDFRALEDVNLTIYEGDFLGIIGPNGGGKTTLIKTILSEVRYSGDIEFAPGLSAGKGRKAIGYLPQQNAFDKKFPISVREVVLSGLQSRKGIFTGYSSGDRAKATEIMEMTGIFSVAHKPIGEISGGQMQRALLCRAIISDPQVLILDEPANFVDNRFEGELYELLHRLNERMAIIMVSHDLGTISPVVKTIVCVNKHVHRHDSNVITAEQLENYDCPIQLVYHGEVPHTVLGHHHK